MKCNWGLMSTTFPRPLAHAHSTLGQKLQPSRWWVFLPRELVTVFRKLATESTRPRSLKEGAGGFEGGLLRDLLLALDKPLPGWWYQMPRLSLLLYCHPPLLRGPASGACCDQCQLMNTVLSLGPALEKTAVCLGCQGQHTQVLLWFLSWVWSACFSKPNEL